VEEVDVGYLALLDQPWEDEHEALFHRRSGGLVEAAQGSATAIPIVNHDSNEGTGGAIDTQPQSPAQHERDRGVGWHGDTVATTPSDRRESPGSEPAADVTPIVSACFRPTPRPTRHQFATGRCRSGLVRRRPAAAGIRRVHVLAWRDLDDIDAGGSEVHADELMSRWASHGLDVLHRTSAAVGLPASDTRNGYAVVRRGSRYSVFPRTIASELTRRMGRFDALVEIWNGVPGSRRCGAASRTSRCCTTSMGRCGIRSCPALWPPSAV
jgi:hypothetical protein